jgi:hypothetical protein
LVLTLAATAVSGLIWGREALLPAASFGLLATLIHLSAVALLKPGLKGSLNKLMARWAMGLGLRLVGVVIFAVVVLVERELFPPLPAAIGFVGVMLPLLFSEMRLIR